jgi:valyl-tRNA synthetase
LNTLKKEGLCRWLLPDQAAGLELKQEPHTMRVPRSQRGGEVVEPLVREQWFVRMQPLAQPALEVRNLPQQ